MTNTQVIANLWQELRTFINTTYERDKSDNGACLRDYAENVSWSDALDQLWQRETTNEKQHRSNRPAIVGFSAGTAAKLILMENVCKGVEMRTIPSATAFLVLRQTAVEAEVIGFLIRKFVPAGWTKAVRSFDYAKLMQPELEAESDLERDRR